VTRAKTKASAIELAQTFWRLMATNDFASVGAVLAPEFVLEWPQSNERIRGAERFAQMNREYPAHGPWRFTIHRVVGGEFEAVSDVGVTDGVQTARAISFFTVAGGKITRLVEFWPEPYPAPAHRSHLVETLDPGPGDNPLASPHSGTPGITARKARWAARCRRANLERVSGTIRLRRSGTPHALRATLEREPRESAVSPLSGWLYQRRPMQDEPEAPSNPASWLRLAREGDAAALGQLLDGHQSYLTIMARVQVGRRLQGKIDPSDLVQETFLEASRDFARFRGQTEAEFLAWLRQILIRNLANLIRRYCGTQARDVNLERDLNQEFDQSWQMLDAGLVADQSSPSQQASRREMALILARALERLPADYRETIVLRHLEGLTFPEVARRMDRTEDSVKKLWVRALARLRSALKETLDTDSSYRGA
jgi:RNA polymerase sigma-70 factor (ECF subfamily)